MKRSAPRSPVRGARPYTPRKTIYDLPPLELECMKALWRLGEASVREIREQLAAERRPLAYTTVETIMDRLTRKAAVARRKLGRAHRYTPLYLKAEARAQAVEAVLEHFFDGSRPELAAHLSGKPVSEPRRTLRPLPPSPPRVPVAAPPKAAAAKPRREPEASQPKPEAPIDTSLL